MTFKPGFIHLYRFIATTSLALAELTAFCQVSTASHLGAPIQLRCESKTDPFAIDQADPELSWRLVAARPDLHSVRQSAYELRIAHTLQDLTDARAALWDSGKIESNQPSTASHPYAGPPLEPQRQYTWQVRVWDEHDHPSPWSQPAHWIQAPEWHARWIAADPTDVAAGTKPMPLFRKTLDLPDQVKYATLYVSGLGQYEFHINGSRVGGDELTPGWSDYHKTVYYDAYDVTTMLRKGINALGILLGNGMYRVPKTAGRYIKFAGSFGPPTCIAQLHLELTNGKNVDVVTDDSWRTHAGPITFSNTYGGEDYDARQLPRGWDTPTFQDADWSPALIGKGPGGTLRPEAAPPVKVMHTYASTKRTEPKPGVLVYDLGQNFAGWPEITVHGAAGSTVKLIPGELLNPDGTVSQHSSGEPQWFSYTLKGSGEERWHPRFSYYGFRYVQVEGAASGTSPTSTKPVIVAVRGEAVHTSSQPIGTFESSDELLNRIHTLIVRAIENNSVSLFTDCPHREKLGWLEETHLLASSMLYDFKLDGLYAATARNIADTQKQDEPNLGRVPEIAPQYVVFGVDGGIFDDSPEWGSAAVLAPWYVFQRDGDVSALVSHLDVMRHYVDYLGTRAHDNIIAYGLGDWYDIGPGEPGVSKLTTSGVTATATYYQDLLVVAQALALGGRQDESQAYAAKADAVRRDFNARFFDATKHLYDKGSQTAQAMPLVVGLVPEEERQHVLNALVADIRAHENHVTAGDIGFHYVVDALLDGSRSDVLYDMLERTDSPSYGYQLAKGATALTEAWDANPNSSQDHFMLGHAEEWFYRGLGGIQIDFAAIPSQQLVLKPQVVGKLTSVRTRYVSTWGPIVSNWKRGPARTDYEFEVPANATATVELATADPTAVQVNQQTTGRSAGVVNSTVSSQGITLVLGSGKYSVTAPNPPIPHDHD